MRATIPPSSISTAAQDGPDPDPVLHVEQPFSAAELCAMSIDGLVSRIYGSSYLTCGAPLSTQIRAQAIWRTIPVSVRSKMTIGRLSAAWIYGCAPAPQTVSLLADHSRRTTAARPFTGIVVHEVDLPAGDIATVAGAAVTTPLRTACDLALYVAANRSAPALMAMAHNARLRCALPTVHAQLVLLGRVPRKRAALALVEAIIENPAPGAPLDLRRAQLRR